MKTQFMEKRCVVLAAWTASSCQAMCLNILLSRYFSSPLARVACSLVQGLGRMSPLKISALKYWNLHARQQVEPVDIVLRLW